MYTFEYMDYPEVLNDFHTILGIDETIMPQSTMVSLPILPAAEMRVIEKIPNWATLPIDKVRLATLYYAAALSFHILKLNVLLIENDNKTIGQRFKDALDWASPELLEKKAQQLLIEMTPSAENVPAFTISRPERDVITGDINA